MLYQINVASQHYVFEDLKTILAKATPERSGDQLAGIAAVDATERVAAQMCLAEVPLQQFLHEALIPYEKDEVTRLILDMMPMLFIRSRILLSEISVTGCSVQMPPQKNLLL